MKPLCVSFLLLALTTVGSFAESAEVKESRENAVPIALYTHFEQEYSEVSLREMKSELAAIMGPIGLDFEWRSLDTTRGNEVSAELVVVTFMGKCAMDDTVLANTDPGALGWTHMSDGSVLPFSDVQCDSIRGFISPAMAGQDLHDRQAVLGRAMGRVLAHELYHVFANTTRHGAQGVAKAFYSASELVSENFQFQAKEAGTLRNGKLLKLIRASGHGFPSVAGGQ